MQPPFSGSQCFSKVQIRLNNPEDHSLDAHCNENLGFLKLYMAIEAGQLYAGIFRLILGHV
jgi:hypothetical protein